MDFDLSDTQKMLQETVRRFFHSEVPPERLLEIYNLDEGLDKRLWAKAADLGLSGLLVPEVYGGSGLDVLDAVCVSDAMGYCAAPGPYLSHWLLGMALALGGDEAQKQKILPGLASGELVGGLALSESGKGWEPEDWTLSLTGQRVSGSKENVLFAQDADVFLIGLGGERLGIVSRDANGVSVTSKNGIDRTRRLGTLELDNVACEVLSGGRPLAERVRDAGLNMLAADSYGGAHRAIELTVDYANERVQFGRKIGSFQGVKHQIADAASAIEPARQLVWYAAYAHDRRLEDSSRLAAISKAHMCDLFYEAARTMVMLHGGIGYTWEYMCHFWIKRSMFNSAYLGASYTHRNRAAEHSSW